MREPVARGHSGKFKKGIATAANSVNYTKGVAPVFNTDKRAVAPRASESEEAAARRLALAAKPVVLAFGRQLDGKDSKPKKGGPPGAPGALADAPVAVDRAAARHGEPMAPPPPVAPWRRRVHRARFVATQTVRTVLRLRGAVRKVSSSSGGGSAVVGHRTRGDALGHYIPLALRLELGAYLEQRDRWQELSGEAAAFQAELDEVTRLLPPGQAITLARQLNTGLSGYNVLNDPLLSSTRTTTTLASAPPSPATVAAALGGRPPALSAPGGTALTPTKPRFTSTSADHSPVPRPPSPRGGHLLARLETVDSGPNHHGPTSNGHGGGGGGGLTHSLSYTNIGSSGSGGAGPLLPALPNLALYQNQAAGGGSPVHTPPSPTSSSRNLLARLPSLTNAPGALPSEERTSLNSGGSSSNLLSPAGRVRPVVGHVSPSSEDSGSGTGSPSQSPTAAGSPRPPPTIPSILAADRSRLRRSSVVSVRSTSTSSIVLVTDRERRESASDLFAEPSLLATSESGGRKSGGHMGSVGSERGRSSSILDETSFFTSSSGNDSVFFPPPVNPKHAVKMKQYAALPAVPRWQALYRYLQDLHRQLSSCQSVCGDIVLRTNSEWADRHSWGAPVVHDQPCQASWTESERCKLLEMDIARKLRHGQLAVQLFAGQDALWLPSGELQDLWTADPWLLVALCQPEKLPSTPLLEGRSWGSRVLSQLVAAVMAVAGPDAVAKLTVVLHINDQQQQQVLADVWDQPVYSQIRGNLLVVVQQRASAYVFDDDDRRFCEDSSTPAESSGSGYSLLQLGWRGAAQVLTDEGELRPLEASVLEVFAQRKIEWMTSHRIRDLGLLNPNGLLDMPMLAYSIFLVQTHRVNMTIQVIKAIGTANSMSYDSVVLIKKPRQLGQSGTEAERAMARNPPDSVECVSELRHSDMASQKMQAVLRATAHEFCNQVAVGLSRYLMHVPALSMLLDCPSTFRPKLSLVDQKALRVHLDMADVTCSHRIKAMALAARDHAGVVRSTQDVGLLVPFLLAHDTALRAAELAAAAAVSMAPPIVPLFRKPRRRTPQSIVVLVTSDPVSDLAVAAAFAVAKPGRDTVHLLTIVQNDNQREGAVVTLERYLALVKPQDALTVTPHIIVRHDLFLLDVLDQQLEACGATLLVMGSMALTTCNLDAFMSSITLACLRRFSLPLMVLTSNARGTTLPDAGNSRVRCLAIVEPHARPMLHFMCGLLDHADPLTLGQVVPPAGTLSPALASSMRTLLHSFADLAAGLQMNNTSTSQLEGQFERAVLTAVKQSLTQLLALQLPGQSLKTVSPHIFYLLRTCPCPILLYPSSRRK